VTHYTGGYQCC